MRRTYLGRALTGLLATVVILLQTGCLSRSAPEVSYYSLLSVEHLEAEQSTESAAKIILGVGPITVPDSLKRSQIVTRESDNRYHFDEFHRWVGILERDIAVVLGDNLEVLLGVDNIVFYPWRDYAKPTHQVLVDIVRFDGSLDGDAVLSARWAVADTKGQLLVKGGKSVYRQALESNDYSGLVRAESLLLVELSREIARQISALGH